MREGIQEARSSHEKALAGRDRKDWQKELKLFAAEAHGTSMILRKGFNSVAVACPDRDGLVKAARRSNTTRPVLRQQ